MRGYARGSEDRLDARAYMELQSTVPARDEPRRGAMLGAAEAHAGRGRRLRAAHLRVRLRG